MNFDLSEDQQQVQEWARKFSREVVAPLSERHRTEKISSDFLKRLSEEGFMSLMVPEDLGGLGLDARSFSLVITELSEACASTGVSVAVTNMIADVLLRECSEEQKEQYIKILSSGESLTASFCLTENSSGSDAAALKTTANKEGDSYVLKGEKIYVTNGAYSNFFLVMARSSDEPGSKGISAFLVDRDQDGLVIGKEEEKMGLEGSSTIRMVFEDVKVPESRRVGPEGEGFKIAMRALDGGRISVASQALGISKAALKAGLKYSKEREQFGKAISDFQAIQWKLADCATEWSAAQLLVWRAAALKDQKVSFSRAASMAKLFTTEAAIRICDEMIQVHGGYGYIKEYPVEGLYRDVRVTSLYEGTSEIQRLVIARDLLSKGLA